MKPTKVSMRDSINYYNEEIIQEQRNHLSKIQLLRDELNLIGSMSHKKYNKNVLLFEKSNKSQLRWINYVVYIEG